MTPPSDSSDPADNPILDLRSGDSIWELDRARLPDVEERIPDVTTCDIVIVGAGITGAFLAERLSRRNRSIVVVDRHTPQTASTAASTALLQWELDAPLLALEQRIGFEKAASVYRRCRQTVASIGLLAADLRLDCGFAWRDSLYFAGTTLDLSLLREEKDIRHRAGLGGEILGSAELAARFGFEREGALHSGGSAEAHPIDLASHLMRIAVSRGVTVHSPALVTDYQCSLQGVELATPAGHIVRAGLLLLANGYEMPGFVRSDVHRLASTWALATAPQDDAAIWPGRCLAWEASDPYIYLRTTGRNEIIIGGEDEDGLTNPAERDRLTSDKVAVLLNRLEHLVPAAHRRVRAAWSGFFGTTRDALPLIGPVPGCPNCYAAFGYGGNGITFSAIAAEMLEKAISGERDRLQDVFAVDR